MNDTLEAAALIAFFCRFFAFFVARRAFFAFEKVFSKACFFSVRQNEHIGCLESAWHLSDVQLLPCTSACMKLVHIAQEVTNVMHSPNFHAHESLRLAASSTCSCHSVTAHNNAFLDLQRLTFKLQCEKCCKFTAAVLHGDSLPWWWQLYTFYFAK